MEFIINEYDARQFVECITSKSLVYAGILHLHVHTQIVAILNDLTILPSVLVEMIYGYIHDFLLVSYTIKKKQSTTYVYVRLLNGIVNDIPISFDYTVEMDSIIHIVSKNTNNFIKFDRRNNTFDVYFDTLAFFNWFMKQRYGVSEYIYNPTTSNVRYDLLQSGLILSRYHLQPFFDTNITIMNETVLTYVIMIMRNIIELLRIATTEH